MTVKEADRKISLDQLSVSGPFSELSGPFSAFSEKLNTLRSVSATIVQADLGSDDEIEKLAARVRSNTGKLDLLVNNASQFSPTDVGSTTPQQWDRLLHSNLRGPYFLTQALLPELARATGCVVNLLDVHASRPMRGHAVYCIAKPSLQMMTLALAKDLGPGIRVNGVAPGAILWPEQDSSSEEQQKILKKLSWAVPEKRRISPRL